MADRFMNVYDVVNNDKLEKLIFMILVLRIFMENFVLVIVSNGYRINGSFNNVLREKKRRKNPMIIQIQHQIHFFGPTPPPPVTSLLPSFYSLTSHFWLRSISLFIRATTFFFQRQKFVIISKC